MIKHDRTNYNEQFSVFSWNITFYYLLMLSIDDALRRFYIFSYIFVSGSVRWAFHVKSYFLIIYLCTILHVFITSNYEFRNLYHCLFYSTALATYYIHEYMNKKRYIYIYIYISAFMELNFIYIYMIFGNTG